jgi:rRNA maturation endonuclease Nob1
MSDPISYMPWMVKKDNEDPYQCLICSQSMDKVDFDFCDICGDCLDEEGYI